MESRGVPEREGSLLLPRMRKVALIHRKQRVYPQGGHFGVIFGTPDVADTCGVCHAFQGSQRGSKRGGFGVLPSLFRTCRGSKKRGAFGVLPSVFRTFLASKGGVFEGSRGVPFRVFNVAGKLMFF